MKYKMATASPSASTSERSSGRPSLIALLGLLCTLGLSGSAAAGPSLSELHGHLGLGYAKLMNRGSPGGSLAIGAGVELPILPDLSAGVDLGFALLGSQTFQRGSLSADVDYSLFEALFLLHLTPQRGPLAALSVGPGVFHARAGLNTGAPAEFEDLPVEETAPGIGIGLEFGPKRPMLVKAGIEIAARAAWLERRPWTVALARLTVHY
jgi:hypothetical protein